jgi:sulfur relay (sulfurtransferase) DsrF/TusC family protein
MALDRLADIQASLTDLYEQLAGEERAWRLAEEAEKTRLQQKVRLTWQRIREYDREYVLTLSQQVKRQDLPEAVAEIVTAEIVDAVEILEPLEKRDEVKVLLQQILTELQKPGTPASAKLKVAIPIIPNVVSYEIEGDTESVVRRLFPTFVKVYEGLKK